MHLSDCNEVVSGAAAHPRQDVALCGRYVTLRKIQSLDISSLFKELQTPQSVWDWVGPSQRPSTAAEVREWVMEEMISKRGCVVYAVLADPNYLNPHSRTRPAVDHHAVLGMIGYLDIVPSNRTVEAGILVFSPTLQKTAAATEAHLLLLQNVFEPQSLLPYRRVSWKCNSLNVGSRRAAERLGYRYEGTFRNHSIWRGNNRNSDWLSILDDEWPRVKAALVSWLEKKNFDHRGYQINSLETLRQECRPLVE